MPGDEAAPFLAGSAERRRLLESLQQSPASPRTLADELGVAHRTVQRHLAQLADRDWAEKRDGAYHLTTTGALVTAAHRDYLETLGTIETLAPFYRHLPDAEHAPDPRWMGSAVRAGTDDETSGVATVVVAASADQPQAPVTYYVSALSDFETDHVRMLSPVLSRLFEDAHAQLVGAGITHDLVMDVATADRARELNPDEFAMVVGFQGLTLACRPESIDVGLTLGDDRAIMHAYDETGQLQALVDTTSEPFLEWAGDLFDRFRDQSTPIEDPADLEPLVPADDTD